VIDYFVDQRRDLCAQLFARPIFSTVVNDDYFLLKTWSFAHGIPYSADGLAFVIAGDDDGELHEDLVEIKNCS
jgi:hypothetical protein